MNSLKELIKKYGDGKDTEAMEGITDIIGDFLKNNVSEDAYCTLYKDIYSELVGGHYNKEFADRQIEKMYYTTASGEKHSAPYWTENEAREIYEKVKTKLPAEYNFYDFEVVLNMVKSDDYLLLHRWYKEANPTATDEAACAKWCSDKLVELAVNWLNDPDNPFGKEKAWGYFNS